MNNGQVWAAVKRVYVQRSVAAPFIRKVVDNVKALRVGPYIDHASDVGPLENARGVPSINSFASSRERARWCSLTRSVTR